jgi:Tfp pilus assembly protein PilO
MPLSSSNYNYKQDYSRYRHHFGRIYQFYQKPAAKVSTALLLTIFTTIFFAVFAIRPTLITIAELLRKIEDQRDTRAEMMKKVAALNTASQEYEAASATIARLNQAVPDTDQVAPLLKMVEGTAAQNNTAITSLDVEEYSYAPPVPVSKSTPQELKIDLNQMADYASLREYIRNLFYIPRLMAVDTISLSTDSEGGNEQPASQLNLTIGSRTFILPRITNTGTNP